MRLIDADALLQKINDIECVDKHDDIVIKQFVGTIIRNTPAIEAVPVVHGEWIKETVLSKCSVCGFRLGADTYRYCPNCGADMRKEKEVMPAKLNENGCPFDCPCLDDYPDCYCNAKMDGKAV